MSEELKEKKKELAKYKRKVVELAGVVHDIVEDTIWTDYVKLPELSEQIGLAMKDVDAFLAANPELQKQQFCMEELKNKQICECGEKSIQEAIEIFQNTTLPYKKAKKLVTGCNKTCCRRALMALYNMVDFGAIDYEEVAFLIDETNNR